MSKTGLAYKLDQIEQPSIKWVSMEAPEVAQPRFKLLGGSVKLEFDPDEQPSRTLVNSSEGPEVI